MCKQLACKTMEYGLRTSSLDVMLKLMLIVSLECMQIAICMHVHVVQHVGNWGWDFGFRVGQGNLGFDTTCFPLLKVGSYGCLPSHLLCCSCLGLFPVLFCYGFPQYW